MSERAGVTRWDSRFLALAQHVAGWSKDPSTQTGAVIVKGRRVVSLGYNGLPRGVADTPERLNDRELKYRIIVHCERNALLFAREDLAGATLYTWPFMSCPTCAAMVIQAGIVRHVAPVCPPDKAERWAQEFRLTRELFAEAGVTVIEYE